MDDCPDCGDPHSGYCRQALGRMLADQTVEHDRDELVLKLAEHEARIRELEREQREWH